MLGISFPILKHFQKSLTRFLSHLSISDDLHFISSQFYNLEPSVLDDIPISTLFQILSDDSLSIGSEDSLSD
jgi:hypothetical protein